MPLPKALVPVSMRGYKASWLSRDVLAGATLAAVAIPEVMGYTSIVQTPIVTGLYTILLPLAAFALLGSSKLLVVGGDSATAAILAAGLVAAGIPGLQPGSAQWVGLTSLTALLCGLLLLASWALRLGFLGDFLSASVLIGFLTGVGIQVATDQIPGLLGIPDGEGGWVQQQWAWISSLGDVSLPTLAYGVATIAIIVLFKVFLPKLPGAVIAVVGLLIVATVTDAASYGVPVVGAIQGGLPPIGFPDVAWRDIPAIATTAFACFIIIIAQSAATSRSFAMRHGDRADINRDILGLGVANLAAGFSGTFVVNGSPTKTQILDSQRGRTQVANLTVVAITLILLLFFTDLLADLPHAVLAGIVFLIGLELIDTHGLARILRRRPLEFVIALVTTLTVFLVGVGPAVVVAITLSLLSVIARQYQARDFVLRKERSGGYQYETAEPGAQSRPGLIVFRYDADLFFANSSRFVDDVEALIDHAPDPVRWLILDCSSITDIDYSAGIGLSGLLDYLKARDVRLVLARPDADLLETMSQYGLRTRIPESDIYSDLDTAIAAFEPPPAASAP